MTEEVRVDLTLNTSQADAEIEAVQGRVDAVVAGWKAARAEVMRGLGVINQLIVIAIRVAKMTGDVVGQSMLRILQSLMTVITSTVSVMIALSATYITSGILAPVGLVLAAFALGLSIGETAGVIAAQAQVLARMEHVNSRLSALEGFRAQMGGFG